MILQATLKTPVIARSGEMLEIDMRMNTESPIGYIILRDRFYTRKEEAIVREYCTNANDAMISAGKGPGGFRVSFPSVVDPTFRVRDFGAGLTFDEMKNIFAVYFESNKRTEKKLNGMWGLGCKSAWCKSKEFHLHSYQNGTKTTYLAYEDESRRGKIALLEETPTIEADGFEVAVPVDAKDFEAFQQAGHRVLRFFKETPLIEGLNRRLNKPDGPLKGGVSDRRWILTGETKEDENDDGETEDTGVSFLVMCDVAYEVDRYMLAKLSPTNQALIKTGIVIHFPSGALEITPQREGIELSEHNTLVLEKALDRVAHELKGRFEEDISKKETLFAAWLAHSKISERFVILKDLPIEWHHINLGNLNFWCHKLQSYTGSKREACKVAAAEITELPIYLAPHRLSSIRPRMRQLGVRHIILLETSKENVAFITANLTPAELGMTNLAETKLLKVTREKTVHEPLAGFTPEQLAAPAYYFISHSGFISFGDGNNVGRVMTSDLNTRTISLLLGGKPVHVVRFMDSKRIPPAWEPALAAVKQVLVKFARRGVTIRNLHDWLNSSSHESLDTFCVPKLRFRIPALRDFYKKIRRMSAIVGLRPQNHNDILVELRLSADLPNRYRYQSHSSQWDRDLYKLKEQVPLLAAVNLTAKKAPEILRILK